MSSSDQTSTNATAAEIVDNEAQNAQAEEIQPIQAELQTNQESQEEKEKPKRFVQIKVPKAVLKYNLKPQVISESGIVYLNAQDRTYYERTLKNPDLVVWLLCDNLEPNYTAKRFFENGWRMNIQVKIVETAKFDLMVSQGMCARLNNSHIVFHFHITYIFHAHYTHYTR